MILPFEPRRPSSPSDPKTSSNSDVQLAALSPTQCEVLNLAQKLQVLALVNPTAALFVIGVIEGVADACPYGPI